MTGPDDSVSVERITGSDREKKINENLEGVGQILGNLKGMATNMGAEISRQNDQLDVIQGKVSLSTYYLYVYLIV